MSLYINKINDNGNIAVDDTILVKDVPATAGSKMLENFRPLFSAEAVVRLENAGYSVAGKTNVGEFGLDLMGETSYFGANEENGVLVASAASLVARGEVKAALSVDLNGAPRRAAAVSGVSFIKPTYGTVSRYGVIACACSGETVGITAKNAEGLKEILSVIAGHDGKDGTSLKEEKYEYSLSENTADMKICIIKELYAAASADAKAAIDAYAEKLKKLGAEVCEISLDIINDIRTAWQILMSAESCNNLSRFDGVKYGHRAAEYKNIDELYVRSRTEGFGFLTKATILYGSDVLAKGKYESCYDKSLRIRRIAVDRMKELFASCDAVLTPVCSRTEYKKYDTGEAFMKVFEESVFTAVASITGMPALVTEGVQLIGDTFSESKLLSIAHSAEKEEA